MGNKIIVVLKVLSPISSKINPNKNIHCLLIEMLIETSKVTELNERNESNND